jgi:hypothetical protein
MPAATPEQASALATAIANYEAAGTALEAARAAKDTHLTEVATALGMTEGQVRVMGEAVDAITIINGVAKHVIVPSIKDA